MIGAAALGVEGETSLGDLSHQHFIADLQLVNVGSQFAVGDQFKEKFDFTLIGGRHDGIRALRTLLRALHPQGGVLAGSEFEFAVGLHADHPQVGREVPALGDSGLVKLVVGSAHCGRPSSSASL